MKIKDILKDFKNKIEIEVDLTIYPLDVIYRASFYMTDLAYVIIEDENSEKYIKVIFIPKSEEKLSDKKIILEFYNKLLIAYEELKALKDSEDVKKLFASALYREVSKNL